MWRVGETIFWPQSHVIHSPSFLGSLFRVRLRKWLREQEVLRRLLLTLGSADYVGKSVNIRLDAQEVVSVRGGNKPMDG